MLGNPQSIHRAISMITALFLVVIMMVPSIAQSTTPSHCTPSDIQQELDNINRLITSTSNTYADSTQAVSDIAILKTHIQICMQALQANLKRINQVLNEYNASAIITANSNANKTAIASLHNEKAAALLQIAAWDFLDYNLDKKIKVAETQELNNNYFNLYTRTNFISLNELFSHSHFNLDVFYSKISLKQFTQLQRINIVALFVLGILITFGVHRVYAYKLKQIKNPAITQFLHLKAADILILPLSCVALYLTILFYPANSVTAILLFYVLFTYSLLCGTILFDVTYPTSGNIIKNGFAFLWTSVGFLYSWSTTPTFHKEHQLSLNYFEYRYAIFITVILQLFVMFLTRTPNSNDTLLMYKFIRRALISTTLALICYIGYVLLFTPFMPPSWEIVYKNMSLTLFDLSIFWLSWLLFKTDYFTQHCPPSFLKTIKIALSIIYLFILISIWKGYHHFAILFIPNLFVSFILILVFRDINHYWSNIYKLLSDPENDESKKVRSLLNINLEKKIWELYVLRVLAVGLIVAFVILGCMELWGQPIYIIKNIMFKFYNGIHIFNTIIFPVRIIRACTWFVIILLLFRCLTGYIDKNNIYAKEPHSKILLFSIIHYIGFTCALLIAMTIAGISVTNIIVISGALSVGIGFGLQHFASDFISGLFLMINKPIRIGDHVLIGTTEGFVKNIKTLSTQVTALDHSDILIPNSSLLSMSITNFTFNDNKSYRISTNVTLTNPSDFDVAKSLLLDIVSKTPEVIKDSPYPPSILFESNVITISCDIMNVNHKNTVLSALNAEIISAFKDKNIPITLS